MGLANPRTPEAETEGMQVQGLPGLQSELSFETSVRIIIVITIKARVWFSGRAVDPTCLRSHGPSEALQQKGRKKRMREEREKEEREGMREEGKEDIRIPEKDVSSFIFPSSWSAVHHSRQALS